MCLYFPAGAGLPAEQQALQQPLLAATNPGRLESRLGIFLFICMCLYFPAGAGLPAEQQALQQPLLAATNAHLAKMSGAGYRTLVVARKQLQQQQYEAWAEQYKAACASLSDRNARVAAVCEGMECGLTLLGATAVEDKLQVGVCGGNVLAW
jgi:magnesium-transporting ATPase (P-type)